MRVDRRLDSGGVVGLAVSLDAERPHVDPFTHRRQRADRRRQRIGHHRKRLDAEDGVDVAHHAEARHDEAVVEVLHAIDWCGAGASLPALAKAREGLDVGADRVVHADLSVGVVLVADHNRSLRDVFEPAVFHVELIRVVRVNVDRHGHVPERVADECQAGHVLADRRVALALERRVDQRELPERRRVVGEDP